MRGIHFDRPPHSSIHPRIADAAAREDEGMDGAAAINDREPNITVCGHIVRGINLVPHPVPTSMGTVGAL